MERIWNNYRGGPRAIGRWVLSALTGSTQLVGVDMGSRSIKLVELRQQKKGYRLLGCGIRYLERGVMEGGIILDKAKMISAIQNLVEECGVSSRKVAIALSGASVMARRVSVPAMPIEELEHYLSWEGERYFPGAIEDVYFDYHLLPTESGTRRPVESEMPVLLIAAKKDIVEERMELLRESGLTPSVLDVDGFALSNMYAMNVHPADSEYVMVINIGASTMNMVIVRGHTPVFLRDASIGGDRYVERIRCSKGCSQDEAEEILFGGEEEESFNVELTRLHHEITGEVRKTLDHFGEMDASGSFRRLVVCGGCARVVGLLEALQRGVSIPVEPADPLHGLDTRYLGPDRQSVKQDSHLFGVSVGLARRNMGDR